MLAGAHLLGQSGSVSPCVSTAAGPPLSGPPDRAVCGRTQPCVSPEPSCFLPGFPSTSWRRPRLPPTCDPKTVPQPPLSTTHTTGTVTAHQRFVKGLFLHRGLVRCTWVMEIKTREIGQWGVKASQSLASHPEASPLAAAPMGQSPYQCAKQSGQL